MRIGYGYDVHRFRPAGGVLKLGGIELAADRGLAGHSDADVLLHAITDALLGAIAGPDLGELFPSSESRYRSADSRLFIRRARELMARSGWRVANLDTVVIADTPRITPHKTALRRSISGLLGLSPEMVSVKAKTTEGFPPGREGIAAHAVVLLERSGGARRGVERGRVAKAKRSERAARGVRRSTGRRCASTTRRT